MASQKKKKVASPAELANDPSLRWCPYRQGELVYSDLHQAVVRFWEIEKKGIRLASLNGIAPLPELVRADQIRRPSVMREANKAMTQAEKVQVLLTAQEMHDRRTKKKSKKIPD